MIASHLEGVRQQWRGNQRLRLAVLAGLAIAGMHVILSMADRREALGERIAENVDLLSKLERAARDRSWPDRAIQAESLLSEMRESIPEAGTPGRARAELQAWLAEQAATAAMAEVQVRVQDVVDVEGHDGLQQALARMDGTLPRSQLGTLLAAIRKGLPWIQVERLEVNNGEPAAVMVVVRGFYRTGGAEAAVPVEVTPLPDAAFDEAPANRRGSRP